MVHFWFCLKECEKLLARIFKLQSISDLVIRNDRVSVQSCLQLTNFIIFEFPLMSRHFSNVQCSFCSLALFSPMNKW